MSWAQASRTFGSASGEGLCPPQPQAPEPPTRPGRGRLHFPGPTAAARPGQRCSHHPPPMPERPAPAHTAPEPAGLGRLHCRRPTAASPARAEALPSRTTAARMPGTCVRSARARGPGTTTLPRTTLWPTHYNSQNAPRPLPNPVGLNYDSHNAPRPEPDTKTPPSDQLRNPNRLRAPNFRGKPPASAAVVNGIPA